MDETILFPSPNWFLVSGLAVTNDGWLIYGGPSKSLCVLEPRPEGHNGKLQGGTSFQTHVLNRANHDRILSIDVSKEWPVKRLVLTGSADGSISLWKLEYQDEKLNIKCALSHDVHLQEKEEAIGVGFSTATHAITVGSFGHIVKWDLSVNVVKGYHYFLKNFRPTCIACSLHIPLNVAIGTKQGVIFLLDLEGSGKLLYKVRSHNDDIVNIVWCPQYNVTVKKTLDKETDTERKISNRMDKIRNEAQEELKAENAADALELSGVIKNLPEDSFDSTTIVEEDNLFDIYQDHEADEFGHKKFVPKEVLVKVKKEQTEDTNYLDECLKLKEEILQRKNQPEPTIESLVEALDNTHVDDKPGTSQENQDLEASEHKHKHLLASISKCGGIKIWSKSGKLVASCLLPNYRTSRKFQNNKVPMNSTLLWYKPDVLLIADVKNQLLECNPLVIDGKNRFQWNLVHALHRRGLYYIGTDAPRVQDEKTVMGSNYSIWTTAQDRNIVRYSYEKKKKIETLPTCGGFVYMIQPCPYDAKRVAASIGDGAIRVWQYDTLDSDDTKLSMGPSVMHWQNVQGKVLSVAWHPTKENLLAFGTAESRVGIVECGGTAEKCARTLHPSLRGGVYSLRWGTGDQLYACAAGDLYLYHTNRVDAPPEQIKLSVDNEQRQISSILYTNNMLVFGTICGGVGIMKNNQLKAAMFVYSKMIHTVEWHPQQTSNSTSLSQYKDLMAVCSMDKVNTIAILEYKEDDEGVATLKSWKTLEGHLGVVSQLAWNPHIEGQLLSTSQDSTVRVWAISSGTCISIFSGHSQTSLSASWAAFPQMPTTVLSGGGDCCLRLWDITDHPPENFDEEKYRETIKKEKKKTKRPAVETKTTVDIATVETIETTDEQVASTENKVKSSKKFLLPVISKQISERKLSGLKEMFNRYLKSNNVEYDCGGDVADCPDFIKMFGTINEINEILDMEMTRHKDNATTDARIMLSILRGHIDQAVSIATELDIIDSFILSVAPCVSFKYWKDVTQLYVTQIDRMVAKNETAKLSVPRFHVGTVYRKMAALLSIHDIKGAVNALIEGRLYKEAYLLCRTRYMDSIAEETLVKWAEHCSSTGHRYMSAICQFALGNLSQAATEIGGSNDQSFLALAAEVAKFAGQTTFAQRVEQKQERLKNADTNNTEEELEQLPSRVELVMKLNGQIENGVPNGHKEVNDVEVNESVVKENGDIETTM